MVIASRASLNLGYSGCDEPPPRRDAQRKRQAKAVDMSPAASSGHREEASGWADQQQRVVMGGPAASEAPDARIQRDEQLVRLREAIASMSEADQQVIHLRHTAGLAFAEIAETLDQRWGTVLARAHRAMKKTQGDARRTKHLSRHNNDERTQR